MTPAWLKERAERTTRMVLPGKGLGAALRTPGAGRLEQFRRALGELDLEEAQRARLTMHLRESHERLRTLLKPLQPDAGRELRALRQRIAAELSPDQRAHFERLSTAQDRSRLR